MELLQTSTQSCPWCGEAIDLTIDLSGGDQAYVEDCQVCCAPMVVTVRCPAGDLDYLMVEVCRENE